MAYAGRVLEGKEAAYVLAARGAAARRSGQDDGLTPEERIELLAFEMARRGVDFETWTEWTVDQLALYRLGERIHVERVNERVETMIATAEQNKVSTLLRYVVPVD